MELFVNTALSFPTVIYSFLLCLAVLYWILAALGIFDMDALDVDFDMDIDSPFDVDAGELRPEGLAGILLKFKLEHVPVTLILTVLFFFAWLVCYFAQLLVLGHLSDVLRYVLGAAVLAGAFFAAVPITAVVCRPLRALFRKVDAPTHKSILGQTAVVRTGRVNDKHGEATLQDGGAGLILRVRTHEPQGFKRGDRVVLLEYLPAEHAYRVIAEEEFKAT